MSKNRRMELLNLITVNELSRLELMRADELIDTVEHKNREYEYDEIYYEGFRAGYLVQREVLHNLVEQLSEIYDATLEINPRNTFTNYNKLVEIRSIATSMATQLEESLKAGEKDS